VFHGVDRPLLLVGETPTVSIEEARKYTAQDRKEVDMVFQFEHMQIDRGASKWDVLPFDMRLLRGCLARWQEGLADVGWNSLYWDNHDQPRVVSRFGDDGEHRERSAKLLATVLHLQRGTPYVYQGDELGMTNYPFTTIDDFQDIESVNYYQESVAMGEDPEEVLAALRAMSRDNSRTPMQWDDSPHAGFTSGSPWLAANPNYKEVNVARQESDPTSVMAHYAALIRLRHDEPVVAHGDFTLLLPDHDQLFAFTRAEGGTELLVLANFSGTPADVPDAVASAWAGAELVLTNVEQQLPPATGTELAPWESRVLRRARATRRTG
jgi:oligo-1,6-glucosidase